MVDPGGGMTLGLCGVVTKPIEIHPEFPLDRDAQLLVILSIRRREELGPCGANRRSWSLSLQLGVRLGDVVLQLEVVLLVDLACL